MEDALTVDTPRNIDSLLTFLLTEGTADSSSSSVLAPEDEAYLAKLLAALRSGKRAVFIVEDADEKLKYMFSNASRAEAVSMLGKVIEATGRRLATNDD
ncbi:MAG: hypothetical protein JOZ38_03550 [Candidatus Eremiobacteraeota bacterium]|nr:hypothetical protein [Candidatus Eremiobacteraeota bacterium]